MSKYLILLVSIILYWLFQTKFRVKYIYPCMYYNVDSVMYFLLYFVIGYCAFPFIQKVFLRKSKMQRWIISCSGIIVLVYSALLFFGWRPSAYFYHIKNINVIFDVINALISIWLIFIVSYSLENTTIGIKLSQVGVNTLYLCGSEYIIKTILAAFIGLLGFNVVFPNPLSTYIYTIILLLLANNYLVPMEKRMLIEFKNLVLLKRG